MSVLYPSLRYGAQGAPVWPNLYRRRSPRVTSASLLVSLAGPLSLRVRRRVAAPAAQVAFDGRNDYVVLPQVAVSWYRALRAVSLWVYLAPLQVCAPA